MFGAFPFAAGYFGQAGLGGEVVLPPTSEPNTIEMFASYRETIPSRGSYRVTQNLPGSYRGTIPGKGSA